MSSYSRYPSITSCFRSLSLCFSPSGLPAIVEGQVLPQSLSSGCSLCLDFPFFRYQQALLLTPFRSWFKCYVLSDVYSDYTVKNCTRTRPSYPLLAENFFNPIALPIYFLFSAIHSITVSIYYVPGSMCTLYVRIKVPALVELTF